jgi:hypothetical protein
VSKRLIITDLGDTKELVTPKINNELNAFTNTKIRQSKMSGWVFLDVIKLISNCFRSLICVQTFQIICLLNFLNHIRTHACTHTRQIVIVFVKIFSYSFQYLLVHLFAKLQLDSYICAS